MLTFFRGWRRKMGIVTLMMACVFAVGWMRSSLFFEGAGVRGEGLVTDHNRIPAVVRLPIAP